MLLCASFRLFIFIHLKSSCHITGIIPALDKDPEGEIFAQTLENIKFHSPFTLLRVPSSIVFAQNPNLPNISLNKTSCKIRI